MRGRRTPAGVFLSLGLAVAVLLWQRWGAPQPTTSTPTDVVAATPAAAEREPASTRYGDRGFRSRELWLNHFETHGREFGNISAEQYVAQARALRDAALSSDVIQATRGDGVISRFRRSQGAFVAFDADGSIRTFFRPNDGERYFKRQALRRAPR